MDKSQIESRNRRGTTLITYGIKEGFVMVADRLIYDLQGGLAVPVELTARKVFMFGSMLVGSVGMMRLSSGIDPDLRPLMAEHYINEPGTEKETSMERIEYTFEKWIVGFMREQRNTKLAGPESVAQLLDSKMRHTFKFAEILLQHGRWWDWVRGERLVSYIVAGYSADFRQRQIIELGIEYDDAGIEGNGLKYIGPIRHDPTEALRIGEDKFVCRALDGVEPESTCYRQQVETCLAAPKEDLSAIPEPLRQLAASLGALVKVEAKFNPTKVGPAVHAAVIDRKTRKQYLASF